MPLDLVKEREVFVRSFLRKGVEYTEQLLHENTDLRDEIHALRTENARLRAQVASEDAIRDLLKTVQRLESERNELIERSTALEQVGREHAHRQAAVEQEINDLANLYIAAFQLHATFSVRRVVRHICDMLGQLIGAHAFVVYVNEETRAVPIASEQMADEELSSIGLGEGPVGEVCLTGIRRLRETDLGAEDRDDPIAILPLMAAGRPIGAIEIVRVLEQKTAWVNVDHELFQLLEAHAGKALLAAHLFSTSTSPLRALGGLKEALEPRGTNENANG